MMRRLTCTALVTACLVGVAKGDDFGPASPPLDYIRPGTGPIMRSNYAGNDSGPAGPSNDGYRPGFDSGRADAGSDSPFACSTDGRGCVNCGGNGGFYADVGFILAEPMWKQDTALSVRATGSGAVGYTVQDFEFDYGANVGPRCWIGYVGDGGLGVRGRFWEFEDTSSMNMVNNGTSSVPVLITSDAFLGLLASGSNTSDVLDARGKLTLDVADLEVTQNVNFGFCSLVYAAGIRYGRLEQKYDVVLVPANHTDVSALHSSQTFEGWGPSVAYEFRRPLCWGFSLYHSLRVAGCFGKEHDNGSMTFGSTTGTITTTPASDSRDNFFAMGEIEVGAEWSRRMGDWDFTVQTAFVGMLYDYVGFPGFSMMVGAKH